VRRIAAAGGLLVLVLVLVIGQLVLPGIAAQMLRNRLARSGRGISVQVSAFPAIELLWHDADRVEVRMVSYRSTAGSVGSLLDQTAGVGSLRVSIGQLRSGRLAAENVRLVKAGGRLSGSATVTETDLRNALPLIDSVTPVASGDGRLVLRGTATVGVFSGSLDFTVAAQGGSVVVVPDLPLVGSVLTFPVFSNAHIDVEQVAGGAAPGGLNVSATAILR
jgi:hypothetical protein